jgi:hypothetical protein
VSEQPVPSNLAVAETFEKLSQALIAHASALTSFASLYRGGNASPQPAAGAGAADPAPAKAPRNKGTKDKPEPAAQSNGPAVATLDVQNFAVAWIKEGANDAAQAAIKSQVLSIVNKYGGQKIADLPATALGPVLAELQAAKAGGAGAPSSSAIDI